MIEREFRNERKSYDDICKNRTARAVDSDGAYLVRQRPGTDRENACEDKTTDTPPLVTEFKDEQAKWAEWREGVIAAAQRASTAEAKYESCETVAPPDAPHGYKALSLIEGVRIVYGQFRHVIVYPAEWQCKYIGTRIIDSLMPMELIARSENCQVFMPGHHKLERDEYLRNLIEELGAQKVEHEPGHHRTAEEVTKEIEEYFAHEGEDGN